MHSLNELRPGDIMFTTIEGIGGKAVAIGETLNDRDVTWDVAKRVQHVAMVTESSLRSGYPKIVEAMPGGAIEIMIDERNYLTPSVIWVRPSYPWVADDDYGRSVGDAARQYIGTPYSWLDYAALTAHHLHLPVPWLDRYISTSKHMICSQLVDQAMSDAGFHVFDDGRLPQDVTPAALYVQLLNLPGTIVL